MYKQSKHGQKKSKTILYIKSIVFIFLLLIGLLFVRSLYARCARLYVNAHVPYYTYAIDSLLSKEYGDELQRCTPSLIAELGPQCAFACIKEKYPAIASITCVYKPPKHIHCTLRAHEPTMRVNTTMVTRADGVLMPHVAYNAELLTAYPHITISSLSEDADRIAPSMHTTITTLPSSWYDRYYIEWHSDHALVLRDKTLHDRIVVCDPHNLPDDEALNMCHHAAHECGTSSSRKQNLIVDARFANQIIVYGDTGEYGHGSNTG